MGRKAGISKVRGFGRVHVYYVPASGDLNLNCVSLSS